MMDYLLAEYAGGMACQLVQAGHVIGGFLYVIGMAVVVVLGFVCDVATWFMLNLYEHYLPWMVHAWHFFMAGIRGYNC